MWLFSLIGMRFSIKKWKGDEWIPRVPGVMVINGYHQNLINEQECFITLILKDQSTDPVRREAKKKNKNYELDNCSRYGMIWLNNTILNLVIVIILKCLNMLFTTSIFFNALSKNKSHYKKKSHYCHSRNFYTNIYFYLIIIFFYRYFCLRLWTTISYSTKSYFTNHWR